MMKLTSDELRTEYEKQREREAYGNMIGEYLRVKKMVSDSGALTHDECCEIALEICKSKGLFDAGPLCRCR
jgi:hypothetical protein